MVLNFFLPSNAFLCLDQPIVMRIIAIILISGCSKEVSRKAAFFISPKADKPKGDRKYKTKPIVSCMCVTISANNAIFLSFAVKFLLEKNPKALFITAITRSNKANVITLYHN